MGSITAICFNDQAPNPSQDVRPVKESVNKKQQDNKINHQAIKQQLDDEVKLKIQQYINVKVKSKRKICFDDFKIQGKLGEGGFGVVFQAQLKQNIEKGLIERYAIKRVAKDVLTRKKVQQNAKLQKNILATFECKFIVALVMAFQDVNFVYFVMQCATGGDTYSLIKKSNNASKLNEFKSLGQKAIKFIAGCVILGLEYLHEKKIMYRDLKPQNVLMFDNGYVKITDFGLAKKSEEDQLSKTISGTPFYYAPEMILKTGYNMSIDFWTLGVYLYQLSVFEPPFSTEQINRHKFKRVCLDAEANRNWKGANLSEQLKSLINGLLKFNPEERLGHNGWNEVKSHVFFQDFNWNQLENQSMESPIRQLVNKFPVNLKPFKAQVLKETGTKNENLQGWTYIKDGNK